MRIASTVLLYEITYSIADSLEMSTEPNLANVRRQELFLKTTTEQ